MNSMGDYMYTYNFLSSQPLTQQQLDYLNECLENLPYEVFEELPEELTLIELVK